MRADAAESIPLDPPGEKLFRGGTQRVVSPTATLERVRPLLPALGITRIANVTGLDVIGVPVVMVCRPNSRSLSVTQGKGLDLASAKTSGVMEAIEGWHAEHIHLPLKLGSVEELGYTHRLAEVDRLPTVAGSRFTREVPLLWIEGWDMIRGEGCWVPHEMVHTDFRLPGPTGTGCFVSSSNGLASGNILLEAVSHALCEVIERDANALWEQCETDPDETRVDLGTVVDPGCRSVLEQFEAAGVGCSVWEITSDVAVPVFVAMITDTYDELHPLHSAVGYGCHPVREVALLRALTEAAQSRLTVITGSRDDLSDHAYGRQRTPEAVASMQSLHRSGGRPFRPGVGLDSDTFADDVRYELECLRAVGIDQAVIIDLTKPTFGLAVVRAVIPGLEGPRQSSGYVPGGRVHERLAGPATAPEPAGRIPR